MQKEQYDDEHQEEETLQTPGVIDKYKDASIIANKVLSATLAKLKVGACVLSLCKAADEQMISELALVHNKKKTEKGIAFPCCISINEVAGHYSPLEAGQLIADGDLVKVDLGVHIDGYVGMAAHSVQVGTTSAKAQDLLVAGQTAVEAAVRLLKPGMTNTQVTETISKVCESYGVQAVEGVLSHEVKKHLVDGNRVIINKETFELKVDDFEFAQNEVYVLDIMVSSGEGKLKESSERTTVYKRALERMYNLRGKSARAFFTEMIEKYPSMCFSLNGFEDQITAKMGLKECLEHGLLVPYPILAEKNGELVAHFKATVMIGGACTSVLSGLPLDKNVKSEKKIEDKDVLALLALSMDKDEQKKQRKAAKKAAAKK